MHHQRKSSVLGWWWQYCPLIMLVLLWCVDRHLQSPWVDMADTECYHSFYSHVGFRFVLVTVVKTLGLLALTNHEIALILNLLCFLWLIKLVNKWLPADEAVSSALTPWLILASPLFLLTKNILVSDLYAGLLVFQAITLLEPLRKRAQTLSLSWVGFACVLLCVAQNVKETALIAIVAYLMVTVQTWIQCPRAKSLLCMAIITGVLWLLVESVVGVFLFEDPWYRLTTILTKPKGGSGFLERLGAQQSTPVPLTLFHLYSHVKVVGLYGIPGLTALVAWWKFPRHVLTQCYVIILGFMTLAGGGAYLVMERYWRAFLPIGLTLWVLMILPYLGQSGHWKIKFGAWAVFVISLMLSATNYVFRFYPMAFARLTAGG